MEFKEELQKLSTQIAERRIHVTNEEMTKQSLILPFIQVLGFDIYNPLEVRPEFIADFGKKKGEKVDYAIFKDSSPVMFFEAKSVNEKLHNHDAQLCRYFNSTKDVSVGIITNGIEYKFFTDINDTNIMDNKPFFVVNITKLKESDFENLAKFRKDSFNKESLTRCAEELTYASTLDNNIKELLKNPSDEFVRFLLKDFNFNRITSNIVDKFRPIVKQSISNAVLDRVSDGLYRQEVNTEPDVIVEKEIDDKIKSKEIITTDDELKSFEYIKEMLAKYGRNVDQLGYKDTLNYFSIYVSNLNNWFVRINLDSTHRNFITRMESETLEKYSNGFKIEAAPKKVGESRIYIDSVEDIKELANLITYCYDKMCLREGIDKISGLKKA
ncbi:DNA polymerase III subunit epsilon [Desulfosporosinus fructosivorans]|uniref:DNA polymerase III subunit epsilon n=1 Tax=Desulfosporosinus fructosivorans TaxID=2018669 RepID=A0A4Z0R571_9FIRM|nr:type I restriction endonuclease [Desulfosporosinus fructosivorans]TGE37674.1 DNA polymerase III subunit epsilon [Desulfosporosinus fructosivorans]